MLKGLEDTPASNKGFGQQRRNRGVESGVKFLIFS